MRKTLQNLLLLSTIFFSSLGINCSTTKTYVINNFKNPELFYSNNIVQKTNSRSDLLTTLGAVVSIKADNEDEAALGSALTTWGSLNASKEVAREGRSQINVSQNYAQTTAPTDATLIPEYNLPLLERFVADGHQIRIIVDDRNPLSGGTFLGSDSDTRYLVDGFQFLFTCNKWMDLNSDRRLSFDEFMGVKKNFRKEENVQVCFGINGSAMKLKKNVIKETNAKVSLYLFDVNNEVVNSQNYEISFSNFCEGRMFFWDLKNLKPGSYTVAAGYSDDFDPSIDKNRGYEFMNERITTLRQFFQISE